MATLLKDRQGESLPARILEERLVIVLLNLFEKRTRNLIENRIYGQSVASSTRLSLGQKHLPSIWIPNTYERFEDLTLPDVDFHYGQSADFFKVMLSMTLEKEWNERPTAEILLNAFLDFDNHLKNGTDWLVTENSTQRNTPSPPPAPSPVLATPTRGLTISFGTVPPGTTSNLNSPRFSPYPQRIRRTSSQPSFTPPVLSSPPTNHPTTSPGAQLRRTMSNYFPMPWSENLQCSACREEEIEVNYFW